MPKFPDDHPVEILRGSKRLRTGLLKKALARRAAWLSRRIEETAQRTGKDQYDHPGLDELKAIVQAAELLESCD